MSSNAGEHNQEHLDRVFMHVLHGLPPDEIPLVENQIATCSDCRLEIETLRPIVAAFVGWPADVLRPSQSAWQRLAERIARETGGRPFLPSEAASPKLEWEEAAPGIQVKILARDLERATVSMLVRLAPGTDYPGHSHAGIEELHLLHGVLKVDDRTLYPGDFIHAEAHTIDHRVWSETGCTCFLMTSTKDTLL